MKMWRRVKHAVRMLTTKLLEPQQWFLDRIGGRQSTSGRSINTADSLSLTAVYCAVRVLSEGVASLPLFLYKRLPNGDKELASKHSLYKIFKRKPNPEQSAYEFFQLAMHWLSLQGNFIALIERDEEAAVTALWPVPMNRVRIERKGRDLVYFLTPANGGGEIACPREAILHLKGLSEDGIWGMSPIQISRDAIDLGLSQQELGIKSYSNGVKPSGVLEHPEALSDEAHARLKTEFKAANAGRDNFGETLILEEGLKWKQASMNLDDAQYLESRKFQIAEIGRMFRVQAHLLGDLEHATFSNIEQMSLEFVMYTLRPWLVMIEQALNTQVLLDAEQDNYFFEFKLDAILRGDIKTRYEAYQIAINNGWLNADEVRALETLNKLPDGLGEDYYYPGNMNVVGEPVDPVVTGIAANAKKPSIPLKTKKTKAAPAPEPEPPRPAKKAAREIMRPVFEDALERVINKERNMLKNKISILAKGDTRDFADKIDEFYATHDQFFRECISSSITAYCALTGIDRDSVPAFSEAFARQHVANAKRDLVSALEDSSGSIARIELMVGDPWRARRDELIDKIFDAVEEQAA